MVSFTFHINQVGFASWEVPAPFGHLPAIFEGKVHWLTVLNGLGEMFALSLLYLLRTSIHASALKKNVANLVYRERVRSREQPETLPSIDEETATTYEMATSMAEAFSERIRIVQDTLDPSQPDPPRARRFRSNSEIDIEVPLNDTVPAQDDRNKPGEVIVHEIRPPPCRLSLQEIFLEYG